MSDFEEEMQTLIDLREAVRCYLSWVWVAEQEGYEEAEPIQHWIEEMARLSE
jgi:hypothetical protein